MAGRLARLHALAATDEAREGEETPQVVSPGWGKVPAGWGGEVSLSVPDWPALKDGPIRGGKFTPLFPVGKRGPKEMGLFGKPRMRRIRKGK